MYGRRRDRDDLQQLSYYARTGWSPDKSAKYHTTDPIHRPSFFRLSSRRCTTFIVLAYRRYTVYLFRASAFRRCPQPVARAPGTALCTVFSATFQPCRRVAIADGFGDTLDRMRAASDSATGGLRVYERRRRDFAKKILGLLSVQTVISTVEKYVGYPITNNLPC